MSFDNQLTNDFLYLLEICRKPELVFPKNSEEYILSKAWMNRLCTYVCNDTNDRRIKNLYLSHLCAALIERKLRGPFIKLPPLHKLERVDFTTEGKLDAFSPPKGNCPTKPERKSCTIAQPSSCSVAEAPCPVNSNPVAACPEQYAPPTVCGPPANLNRGPQTPCTTHGYENAPNVCCDDTISLRSQGGDEQVHDTSCSVQFNPEDVSPQEQYLIQSTSREYSENIDTHPGSRSEGGSECYTMEDDFINKFLASELNFTPEFIKEFETTLSTFMYLCKLMFTENKPQPPPTPQPSLIKNNIHRTPIENTIRSEDIFGKAPDNLQQQYQYVPLAAQQMGSYQMATHNTLPNDINYLTLQQKTSEILLKAKNKLATQVLMDTEDQFITLPYMLKNVPKTPYPSMASLHDNDDDIYNKQWPYIPMPTDFMHSEVEKGSYSFSLQEQDDTDNLLSPDNSKFRMDLHNRLPYDIDENSVVVERRRDITTLLKMISSELRGDNEPGCSDYLEHELSRYAAFLQNYPTMARYIEELKCDIKLRNFLLLNLQNDLIRLLSD